MAGELLPLRIVSSSSGVGGRGRLGPLAGTPTEDTLKVVKCRRRQGHGLAGRLGPLAGTPTEDTLKVVKCRRHQGWGARAY